LSISVKSPLQCDDWKVYRSVHHRTRYKGQ